MVLLLRRGNGERVLERDGALDVAVPAIDGKAEYGASLGGERCGSRQMPLAFDKVGAMEGVGRRGLSDCMVGVGDKGVGRSSVCD